MSLDREDYRRKDVPPPPQGWWGWRRLTGKGFTARSTWEHFAPANATTKTTCYQKLMDLSELSFHEGQHEYLILPAGQRPPLS